VIPDGLQPNVTGYLVYDANAPLPTPAILDEFVDYDDFNLVPADKGALYNDPAATYTLSIAMVNRNDGKN
jgi:iron transport multicopper oxidase